MPKKPTDRKSVTISFTRELWERIEQEADSLGTTKTAWMQMTLANHFRAMDGMAMLTKTIQMAEQEKAKLLTETYT